MSDEYRDKIEDAVEYGDSTNAIEDNGLEEEELQKIIEDIQSGKSEESFLYSVVKLVKKRQEGNTNGQKR